MAEQQMQIVVAGGGGQVAVPGVAAATVFDPSRHQTPALEKQGFGVEISADIKPDGGAAGRV